MNDFSKLAYVDLETTGGRPTSDRITEIAIVQTIDGIVVDEWHTLVNPGIQIPEMIQRIIGITPAMVKDSPTFEEILPVVMEKLAGFVFVAHNARFDTGFLKNAYKRLGEDFSYPVLCTVKLSCKLYSQYKRHNLDSIIQRFNLKCEARHRALGDAAALPQLVSRMFKDFDSGDVLAAMALQRKLGSVPPHLDPKIFDEMPNEPGVYLLYGESGGLLYVGKSVQIRTRVMSHFSSDHSNDREMRMAQQVHDIEWIVTAGEFSALMLEAELVKKRAPLFNRQLRKQKTLFSLYWQANNPEGLKSNTVAAPLIKDINADDSQPYTASPLDNSYGLFRSRRQAGELLKKIQKEHQLCAKQLGLEKGKGACFSYQLKRCRGVCCEQESAISYHLRLQQALTPIKVEGWPYDGPVGIYESNEASEIRCIHIVSNWLYLGKVSDESELADFSFDETIRLDIDFYRICISQLQKSSKVIPLKGRLNNYA